MIIYIVIIFVLAIYLYGTRNHNYWAKRNIKHDTPIPIFGNYFDVLFGRQNPVVMAMDIYKRYPTEKVVGFYCGNIPQLIIRDPETVRDIMSVDFEYFYKRGMGRDIKKEPFLQNLFSAEGDLWKLIRQRLTPAFTTAKLKSMFPLIVKCAEKLQDLGDEIVAQGGECEVRDLMARFSTEFIGACGLGIEMDTITNENSVFRKMGKEIFKLPFRDIFLLGIYDVLPETRNMYTIFNKDVENFFVHMITKVFEQRKYKPIGRNDFVDLLLDLAAKGKITGQSIEHRYPNGTPMAAELEMDTMCMVAQVFVFFAAGFETSSSSTSYLLYQLALNPEKQKKVHEEIDEILTKYDNKLCYESVAEMTYLDLAFKESLRMHPPVGMLNRECTRKYKIPQLGITIDPGVKIVIPAYALHNDGKYFDNPEQFRPERFASNEDITSSYVYMPFGEGPRKCIGMIQLLTISR